MNSLSPPYFFDNFDLRFEPSGIDGAYRVRVESLAGQASATFTVPLDGGISGFQLNESTSDTLTQIGQTLFNTVFQGDILLAFRNSQKLATDNGKSLRIRLRFHDAPDLAIFPWELLTPPHQNPLSLSPRSPIVHYLDLLDSPKPLPVTLPLRVLVVISAPPSQPMIDGEEEWEALNRAFQALKEEGLVILEPLTHATPSKLQEVLLRNTPYHVIHYIGHSRFNPDTKQGELLLESDDPTQEDIPFTAKDFAQLVADHRATNHSDPRSFRLAYLNSCQGTVRKAGVATSGIAQTLVQHGVPAVIAMQDYLPNNAAVALARHFYHTLAQGNPVDVALSLARQIVRQSIHQSAWALPSLFLRSDNSYLFALPGQVLPNTVGMISSPTPGEPPYQGLAYYDVHDHARFYGREALTRELVAYLETSQLLVVVGASGSGKSSLVRAGVIPTLLGVDHAVTHEDCTNGPNLWQYHLLTPTAHPLTALATSLTKGEASVLAAKQLESDLEADSVAFDLYLRRRFADNPTARLLLVVDQFEELFTLCKNESVQQRFVEVLFHTLGRNASLTLILTLRADFYHKCTALSALRNALEQHQRVIGAMSPEELRCAIELPARQGNWEFEEGLVDLLSDDAGQEPGNLPLLSHALHETWERRSGRTLTFAGYVASGRIQGAIARTADCIYSRLDERQQHLARTIFVELTELGESTQDTRRRVPTTSLLAFGTSPQEVESLLKTLADARLLSTDTDTTEVAHEALIREWATLRKWVNEDRAWVRFVRELEIDAKQWKGSTLEEQPTYLYLGLRLATAIETVASRWGELPTIVQEFLGVGKEAEERRKQEIEVQKSEAQAQEVARMKAETEAVAKTYQNVRLRQFLVIVALLLVAALVAAVVAYQQRVLAVDEQQIARDAEATAIFALATATIAQGDAEEARQQTLSLRLAAESSNLFTENRSSLALLIALEAAKRPHDNDESIAPEAVQQLHDLLGERIGIELGHSASVITLAFSPDGTRLATGSEDGTVRVWNLQEPAQYPTFLTGHSGSIKTLAFSPDGSWLATGGWDGTARVWNLQEPTQDPILLTGHSYSINNMLDFSPDSNWLATGGNDSIVRVWNVQEPTQDPILLTGHSDSINTLDFSPDGNWLATGSDDSTAAVWNLQEPTQDPILLTGHVGRIYILEFSPDGNSLATGSDDSTAAVWNLQEPTQDPIFLTGHAGAIYTLEFSPDGSWLATGGNDSIVRVWNLQEPTQDSILLAGHSNDINTVSFSPDGNWLATGSWDGTARVWNLQSPIQDPILLTGHFGAIYTLDFSPDGNWLATGGNDSTAKVWNLQVVAQDPVLLTGHSDSINTLSFSLDGNWLATGSDDSIAKLWNLQEPAQDPILLTGHFGAIYTLDFSPDGNRMATAGWDGTARVWNLQEPAQDPILLTGHSEGINTLSFSPDGTRIVTGGWDGTARVWNLQEPTQNPILLTGHVGRILTLDFSPDGKWLATGSTDNTARVWNLQEPAQDPILLTGHSHAIFDLDFSPDGKWLATGSADSTARVWNLQEPAQDPILLTGHSHAIFDLDFSPDGNRLATGSDDNTARVWNLREPIQDSILLMGHSAGIQTLDFSPDGKWLATGSADSTARVWNLQEPTQDPILLTGHTGSIYTLDFSPDGKWLATGSTDNTARVWTFAMDQLMDKVCTITWRNMTHDEWRTYFGNEPYRPTCPQWPVPLEQEE